MADYEATNFAIFYNNALFLFAMLVLAFWIFPNASPNFQYCASMGGTHPFPPASYPYPSTESDANCRSGCSRSPLLNGIQISPTKPCNLPPDHNSLFAFACLFDGGNW